MLLAEYRKKIIEQLSPITESARAEAELLLMHALDKTREQLIVESTQALSQEAQKAVDSVVDRRLSGEPIAYILGSQPFWTLDLRVTPDTLIPRPETECLVDWILTHHRDHVDLTIADLGTGTGAIALALASEKPAWKIDAVDESFEALAVAKKNADKHQIKNISFYPGNWCEALPSKQYDVIVSNPPYIPEKDPHLAALTFEPQTALVSGPDGLEAIKIIAKQAKNFLKPGASLVIEHGYDQAEAVANILEKEGYSTIRNHPDLSEILRFVTGTL